MSSPFRTLSGTYPSSSSCDPTTPVRRRQAHPHRRQRRKRAVRCRAGQGRLLGGAGLHQGQRLAAHCPGGDSRAVRHRLLLWRLLHARRERPQGAEGEPWPLHVMQQCTFDNKALSSTGRGRPARMLVGGSGFPVGLRISVCSYLISKLGSLSSVCYLATSPTSPNRAHNPTPRFLLCPRHHPRHHPRRPATRPPPRTTHSTSARRTLGVVQTQCSSPPRSLPPGPAPLAFPYIFRSGPAPQICPPTFPASYLAAPHGPPPPGCGDTIDEWPPPTRHCEIPFNLSVCRPSSPHPLVYDISLRLSSDYDITSI